MVKGKRNLSESRSSDVRMHSEYSIIRRTSRVIENAAKIVQIFIE